MKKILLQCLLFFPVAFLAQAQCTPDPQHTSPGIYPDSTTGLPDARVYSAYSEVVTLVIPKDTSYDAGPPFGVITADIDYIEITNFTGLPPGFSYACSPSNCQFPGNTASCLVITGNPTDTADILSVYNLVVSLQGYAVGSPFPIPLPDVDWYSIRIWYPVGMDEKIGSFSIAQNAPNPFDSETSITVNSRNSESYELAVYNVLGTRVCQRTFMAAQGKNSVTFDRSGLPPGAYFYSIGNGRETMTRKMVIAGIN